MSMARFFSERLEGQLIELGGEDPADPGHPDHDAQGGLLGDFASANSITDSSDPDDPDVKAYKGARHNFILVVGSGGYGTHNPEFARDLLADARTLLDD